MTNHDDKGGPPAIISPMVKGETDLLQLCRFLADRGGWSDLKSWFTDNCKAGANYDYFLQRVRFKEAGPSPKTVLTVRDCINSQFLESVVIFEELEELSVPVGGQLWHPIAKRLDEMIGEPSEAE